MRGLRGLGSALTLRPATQELGHVVRLAAFLQGPGRRRRRRLIFAVSEELVNRGHDSRRGRHVRRGSTRLPVATPPQSMGGRSGGSKSYFPTAVAVLLYMALNELMEVRRSD